MESLAYFYPYNKTTFQMQSNTVNNYIIASLSNENTLVSY